MSTACQRDIVLSMDRFEQFKVANRTIGGGLNRQLCERRERGDSYDDITFWLKGRGMAVSRETVRRWCQDAMAVETVE